MGVGHENVADPENFTGRKRADIAEAEHDASCKDPSACIGGGSARIRPNHKCTADRFAAPDG
jgi:hypothetical protein